MEPGQRLGKYVLGERIAIGGMAEVWAARVEGPEGFVKPLALKFMLESFTGDPELERLFVNEARVAAQLQHANIVSIFDFDKIDAQHGGGLAGRYYIAMERVEGRDLRQIAQAVQRSGRAFPRPLALHVAGEVLKGLRYVHERREGRRPLGLIHRDVSPHNVLVSYAGEVKLSDFGIAKVRATSTSGKGTGSIRGKLAYAAPEQLDDAVLDHRTDQFAFGVTLWELLAGRRLFDGRDELEVMTQISRCEIPQLSLLPAAHDIDPAIEAVVRRMLARDVGDRFATTGEALSAVLALPGYTADSAPLGNMVRTLFGTQTDFPATGPVLSPPPAPPEAEPLPQTTTMQVPRASASPAGTPTGGSGTRVGGPRPNKRSATPTPHRGRRSSSLGRVESAGARPGGALRTRAALVAVGLGLLAVVVTALAIWRALAPSGLGAGTESRSRAPAGSFPRAADSTSPSTARAPSAATAAPSTPERELPAVVAPPSGARTAPPPSASVSVPGRDGNPGGATLAPGPRVPLPASPAPSSPVPAPVSPPTVMPPAFPAPSISAPDAGKRPGAPNAAPIIE